VDVGYDVQGLSDTLADALPDERITVTGLSGSVILDGEVSSPEAARIAESLAQRTAPDAVLSRLVVHGSQVALRVRIMEVSRRGLKDLGAQISAANASNLALALGGGLIGAEPPEGAASLRLTPGDYSITATLRTLETRGQMEILAEPTVMAHSGEKALFHAGGEIPYPTPAGLGQIALEYRRYGAAVTMVPTVQGNGLIRLELDAELSSLDAANSLDVGGFAVPALLVRKATTSAEMRDGQTLLIAGLFENSSRQASRSVPWIDRIPVLGPLTRSIQGAHQQRELVILVTSEIVRPSPGTPTPPASTAAAPAKIDEPPGRPTARDLIRRVARMVRPPLTFAQRMASKMFSGVTRRA